jgi:hypothetical protein
VRWDVEVAGSSEDMITIVGQTVAESAPSGIVPKILAHSRGWVVREMPS